MKNQRVIITNLNNVSVLRIEPIHDIITSFFHLLFILVGSYIIFSISADGLGEKQYYFLIISSIIAFKILFILFIVLLIIWNHFYVVEIRIYEQNIHIKYFIYKFNCKSIEYSKSIMFGLKLPWFQKISKFDIDINGYGQWSLYANTPNKQVKIIANIKNENKLIISDWLKKNNINIV